MILPFALLLLLQLHSIATGFDMPVFNSEEATPRGSIKDLKFVSRVMVPYGPNLFDKTKPLQNATDRPWTGYGYGMGAGEEMDFDVKQKYAYVASAVGFVTVVDFENPLAPVLTDHAIAFEDFDEVNDIAVCPEQGWLFLSIASRGVIEVYRTVQRGVENPLNLELLLSFSPAGGVPSALLPNSNCTMLAVSNENQEKAAYGTVTLIRDLDRIDKGLEPTLTSIPMDSGVENGWDDEYVLGKGLHMPLTKAALEYWDDYSPIADVTNFSDVRNSYRSSLFLEGEYITWANPEETELLVNLQINNGLLRIDVNSNQALALAGYGLKDHNEIPIDIDPRDKDCNLKTYPNLFSLRNPDSIRSLKYNGKQYILTANEGDDKEFREYSDVFEASELFVNEEFGLPGVKIPGLKMQQAELFNSNCEGPGCVGSAELSVGSTAIDYHDPVNPTFQRKVLLGGRGWSIYELPDDPEALLKLVYDSGSDAEQDACDKFPWAFNAEVDEEYAPATNLPNHTLWEWDEGIREDLLEKNDPEDGGCWDQGNGEPGACPMQNKTDVGSDGSGPQIEHIESGVACGRLFAVVASEKTSIAWLYDITSLAEPDLVKTFHLSPANQKKSPGLAYNDGTIGEIDPENFLFLSEDDSPSGKAAILFGGAYSGTLSYWEFECAEAEDTPLFDIFSSARSFTVWIPATLLVLTCFL